MSAIERRGAPEPRWENRPSRNRDFKRPLRLLARPRHPVSTSTWPADSSDSSHRAHRRPVYVSFVSKAILWDRGVCHDTVRDRPIHRPPVCPRFLSHMNAHPEDFSPPCFLSSRSRLLPSSQRKMQSTPALVAPKTQTLEGHFHLNPVRRSCAVQNIGLTAGMRPAVVVPCPWLPATPPPASTFNPTPPDHSALHPDSEEKQSPVPAPPPCLHPPPPPPPPSSPPQDKHPEREQVSQPVAVKPDRDTNLWAAGSTPSASPTSLSRGSLSDLSRPPSSLFSRSTDLASGRSTVLSGRSYADFMDSDPDVSVCFSPSQPSPSMPPASYPPAGSNHHQSFKNATATVSATTPPVYEQVFGQAKPLSTSGVHLNSDKPLSSGISTKTEEDLHLNASIDPVLNPSLDSDLGRATLAFPSATWSSCPSPQTSTPRSGSGTKLTPSPPVSRLESHRWPVLPPISPVRGFSAASHCSEISCSQSWAFDELEAVAPPSTSCLSLDQASDSSGCNSPDKELSPGLAALTVGCDSGNLGSLSRVQLLLLDRQEPESLLSPFDPEEGFSPVGDWPDLTTQYDPESAGVLRPLTAGSISERCDSAGKVEENKSDQSEEGSGSPSSWIIDLSPSFDMFRPSPCPSSRGSHTGEEEDTYPEQSDRDGGGNDENVERRTGDEERRMEERKTKVLKVLSKLQDDTPRQSKSSKGRSNFEDFDFLAKYCIFSQEKLAEYKRAFEAEDGDADGYISCLQVLLALKNIIPPELLSDEEEIYVYRILEMVDFRVTDGLVDLRLFAVIASLAQKIASMDEFMRSLISSTDFRSLEVRLFKAKQLFLFLLDEQQGAEQGFISSEQLLLELKAGGIRLEQEAAIRLELQHIPPLDLLDFLAYLPLFMLIHKSVISNPLDDSGHL